MHQIIDHRVIHPSIVSLLKRLDKWVVVIGSVARGDKAPGDLDLWLNVDGLISGKPRYEVIKDIIGQSGLSFDSPFPTCWSFPSRWYPDVMVELIGCPNIPATFGTVRRLAQRRTVFGIDLPVALPKHAGTSTKTVG